MSTVREMLYYFEWQCGSFSTTVVGVDCFDCIGVVYSPPSHNNGSITERSLGGAGSWNFIVETQTGSVCVSNPGTLTWFVSFLFLSKWNTTKPLWPLPQLLKVGWTPFLSSFFLSSLLSVGWVTRGDMREQNSNAIIKTIRKRGRAWGRRWWTSVLLTVL